MVSVKSIEPAGPGMPLMLRGYAGENVSDIRVVNCPESIVREVKALRIDNLTNIEPH
jgi:hypothetical protein